MTFENQDSCLPQDLWEKRCRILEFTACKLTGTLDSWESLSCHLRETGSVAHLSSQQETGLS